MFHSPLYELLRQHALEATVSTEDEVLSRMQI